MSDYIDKRSEGYLVKHLYSGKSHFFNVIGSKSEHNVIIKASCDCRYSSVQGIANGEICSHILSVFKKIVEDKKIDKSKQD